MKTTLTNYLIRLLGFLKRTLRLIKVFINQNKLITKYSVIGAVFFGAAFIIIILASNSTLGLSAQLVPSPNDTALITPISTSIPTAAQAVHINGNAPLIVLDCSTINDNDYIKQTAFNFGIQNDIKVQYIKVDEKSFIETYNAMVQNNNKPNVVIAPNDLIMQLGEFEDISYINDEILFNKASKGAVRNDKIPLALSMYGYFFRADLLYLMSQQIPKKYQDILPLSETMRSDRAYSYMKDKQEDIIKAEKKDEFLTSRYGFSFAGGDVAGELFLKQAMAEVYQDNSNILHDIEFMWDELYLPPDVVYSIDENMVDAFLNDALCAVFAPAILYEKLIENQKLYYGTQIKPYLGEKPVYTANVIYCAIPDGSDVKTASSFISILYSGGNLDKIIVQNHTAILPISMFYNQSSPWIGALNEDTEIIYYENDVYINALKRIILAGESVETAVSKSHE